MRNKKQEVIEKLTGDITINNIDINGFYGKYELTGEHNGKKIYINFECLIGKITFTNCKIIKKRVRHWLVKKR